MGRSFLDGIRCIDTPPLAVLLQMKQDEGIVNPAKVYYESMQYTEIIVTSKTQVLMMVLQVANRSQYKAVE